LNHESIEQFTSAQNKFQNFPPSLQENIPKIFNWAIKVIVNYHKRIYNLPQLLSIANQAKSYVELDQNISPKGTSCGGSGGCNLRPLSIKSKKIQGTGDLTLCSQAWILLSG
jgi:hypothetical protein